MLKATKCLQKGCIAYLVQISTSTKEKKIEDVPVVTDHADIFPDELPGILSEREVEFKINLVPGTAPIAKAPYRLAPTEMKELETQLDEILEKGFIRLSSSPWGAPILFRSTVYGSCSEAEGYYRRFIQGFSKFAVPLTTLTRKNVKYEWGTKQEEAFQTLKGKLTHAPILAFPDEKAPAYLASTQEYLCVLVKYARAFCPAHLLSAQASGQV
ncbi:hypothetical protein L1987_18857 [Smallanthus sonchifolius]|uniref:Uncharacterized protein n=1 Tax=Smallanthus sonchifolius TaxID=185202 RepID=A0ACB9J320_9ASTR|nr:hypothetical protein L1987_18857 [Smallanthus sonchifolius]